MKEGGIKRVPKEKTDKADILKAEALGKNKKEV